MASADALLVGATVPGAICGFGAHAGRELPRGCKYLALGVGAAAATATAIGLANTESDREPDAAEWVVVGTPAVLMAVSLTVIAIDWMTDRLKGME